MKKKKKMAIDRKTRTSKRVENYANRAIKASRNALLVDVCEGMYKEFLRNNHRLPYGHVTKLLHQLKAEESWITKNMINKSFMKYRADQKKKKRPCCEDEGIPKSVEIEHNSALLSELSNVSNKTSNSYENVGRPNGSTAAKKESKKNKLIEAKNEITRKYAKMSREVSKKCSKGRVSKGALQKLIDDEKKKRKINDEISPIAIRKRVQRNSLETRHLAGGQVSPLLKIEPAIVSIIVQMARMRQCLNPSKGLLLVNSLIRGTKIQEELIEWKKTNTPNCTGTVGRGYWRKFMRRNKSKIVGKRGQKYELNRQNWTTYNNFVQMYKHIIDEMVDAGLAVELDEPVWMNRDGNICPEHEAFGCKVHHKVIHPELCFCGDEVGGNISMKGDGHHGGELLLAEKGTIAQRKSSTRNRKFTLIGLTSFTGDPVMCVIIIEGKLPNGAIEAGVDIRIEPNGKSTDKDFLINNSGKGKHFPGGPECVYRGKTVPALVRWHESASITSEILVDMLQTLDEMELVPRNNGVNPLILLDGHRSRLEMPFLKYVNTPEDHWVAVIGVPYGTALWQVGDSKEQNGSFNMAITKAKQNLLEMKDSIGMQNAGMIDTDLMPLINEAWEKSFARVDKNRNAIADRGWNPLNKALLLDPTLRSTMTSNEKSDEYQKLNQIILPNKSSYHDKQTTESLTTETDQSDELSSLNNNPICNDLNFSEGMSSYCLKAFISNEQLQQAREELRKDMDSGKSIKQQLKESTRLSAGILFKAGSSRLGKTVFDVHRENLEEKNKDLIEKIKKDEKNYYEQVRKAEEVFEKKKTIESMTIKELTIICKPLKRKEDGKMPNKKDQLIQKFKEWSGRPTPSFSIDHLQDDIDGEIDNDDRVSQINEMENIDVVPM